MKDDGTFGFSLDDDGVVDLVGGKISKMREAVADDPRLYRAHYNLAVILLALVDGLFKLSLLFPLVVGLTCLTGSVAILRQVPGAPLVTFVAVVVAYVLLGELISV